MEMLLNYHLVGTPLVSTRTYICVDEHINTGAQVCDSQSCEPNAYATTIIAGDNGIDSYMLNIMCVRT